MLIGYITFCKCQVRVLHPVKWLQPRAKYRKRAEMIPFNSAYPDNCRKVQSSIQYTAHKKKYKRAAALSEIRKVRSSI